MLTVAIILIAAAAQALACPMCNANVANAENAADTAKTINAAILVLLIPTFVIIGGLIGLVFKYRHYQSEEADQELGESSSRPINSYVNLRTSDSERNSQ